VTSEAEDMLFTGLLNQEFKKAFLSPKDRTEDQRTTIKELCINLPNEWEERLPGRLQMEFKKMSAVMVNIIRAERQKAAQEEQKRHEGAIAALAASEQKKQEAQSAEVDPEEELVKKIQKAIEAFYKDAEDKLKKTSKKKSSGKKPDDTPPSSDDEGAGGKGKKSKKTKKTKNHKRDSSSEDEDGDDQKALKGVPVPEINQDSLEAWDVFISSFKAYLKLKKFKRRSTAREAFRTGIKNPTIAAVLDSFLAEAEDTTSWTEAKQHIEELLFPERDAHKRTKLMTLRQQKGQSTRDFYLEFLKASVEANLEEDYRTSMFINKLRFEIRKEVEADDDYKVLSKAYRCALRKEALISKRLRTNVNLLDLNEEEEEAQIDAVDLRPRGTSAIPDRFNAWQKERIMQTAQEHGLEAREVCWRCGEKVHTRAGEQKTCLNRLNLQSLSYNTTAGGRSDLTDNKFPRGEEEERTNTGEAEMPQETDAVTKETLEEWEIDELYDSKRETLPLLAQLHLGRAKVKQEVCFDTGASRSVIREKLARQLKLDIKPPSPKWVRVADNSLVSIIGEARLPLWVGEETKEISVLVLEKLNRALLLGHPELQQLKCEINLSVRGSEVKFGGIPVKTQLRTAKNQVVLSNNITIPAGCEVMTMAESLEAQNAVGEVLLVSSTKLSPPAQIATCLVPVLKSGGLMARLANLTDRDVHLRSGTVLGRAEKVHPREITPEASAVVG
jgi:hypothetical protein